MDARTLKALKASIAKWEKNAVAEKPRQYLTGWADCPLCKLFYFSDCRGCPVMNATGEEACEGTPYRRAVRSLERWEDGDTGPKPAHSAASAEVDFLKSLLPPEEAP